jgi:hypothetical protein
LAKAANNVRPDNYRANAPDELLDAQHSFMRENVRDGLATLPNLTPHLGRLQLRLGANHPVVALYRELTELGNDVANEIPLKLPGTEQQARNATTAARAYATWMEQFIEAAHALVGTSAPALVPPGTDSK